MARLHPLTTAFRRPLSTPDAPGAGTTEVQTLTIGGTPTGGTFTLSYKSQTTAPITWSATDATLVANIDAALGALTTIGGAANVTVATGTLSSGIGAASITFAAALAKLAVPLIAVVANSLTGTSPTVAVTEATPGVSATGRGYPKGQMLIDTDNGIWYQNTGTAYAPTWTAVDVASVAGEVTDLASALPTAAVADVAGLAPTIAAANGVAVAGTTPAGGTGATAGAYDTANNRDAFIATVAEMKTTVNAAVALLTELKTDYNTTAATVAEEKVSLNALLAALRTAGVVTP